MLEINRSLLDSLNTEIKISDSFYACLNEHGLYNSAHFVVRLSPQNHQLLDSGAQKSAEELTWEEVQAYSTYIHETVHWWQHIGSTAGIVLSMCYPGQAHANITHLRKLADSKTVGKSIKDWAEAQAMGGLDNSNELVASANLVVNNVMDLEFFRSMILKPQLLRQMVNDNYFESVGHSFSTAYSVLLQVIETTLGADLPCLPKYNNWPAKIETLTAQERGYYHYKSPIALPPSEISGLTLLEGQARLIQLQFLQLSSQKFNKALNLFDFEKNGYLKGIYGDAFRYFISRTNSEFPSNTYDPIVGLFLLTCDLALNPGEGFPFDISDFENFPLQANPSIRFTRICESIRTDCSYLKTYLNEYSKDEYFYASSKLAESCGYHSPLAILSELAKWPQDESAITSLLKEQETFEFTEANQPVRVIFSHFLRFNQDKLEAPEFFCWSGLFRHTKADPEYNNLWLRNLSLFTDKADDNGIYPRLRKGVSEKNLINTLNSFYGNSINYDLTRQWTIQSGNFKYDYLWLTESFEESVVRDKAQWLFEGLYGITPDTIENIK
ncbi:hypothetical protein [Pseudomonas chlororaphis]|uniref:hypothetical protein n=1 Tax=Pseudomonas chlororaphis TaxID=587753 RepID=UPI000B31DAC0|nr:hypothetical protein [Pseudomonas chlororaphis]